MGTRARHGIRRRTAGVLGVIVLLAGCATPSEDGAVEGRTPPRDAAPALPPTSGSFDYQLGGAYGAAEAGLAEEFDVVVRDATAAPLPGAYSICYVNGFQTQPEGDGAWDDHPEAILVDPSGEPVVDPDWPDERILDPGTPETRESILDVLGPVVEGCAADGFDAVEIDNLDTFARFPAIDEDGALTLARAYVDLAHANGLAIGQKNAADIAPLAHDELGFDFAVTEECGRYAECGAYTGVYGDHVLQIEYPGSLADGGTDLAAVCADPERAPLTILRDIDLVDPGDPEYVRETC